MLSGYNEQTFLREYLDMSYDTYHYSKPEHPQLIFIHGSGTTSLVHALAEEHNFKVKKLHRIFLYSFFVFIR